MAQAVLVDEAVESGRKLIRRLDGTPYETRSALWLYRPDSTDWVLLLAMPAYRSKGPRTVYSFIQELLKTEELPPLALDDIVATDPDDPLVDLLRTALTTGPGIGEIRFTRNRIGNTFIEDALVYRLQ